MTRRRFPGRLTAGAALTLAPAPCSPNRPRTPDRIDATFDATATVSGTDAVRPPRGQVTETNGDLAVPLTADPAEGAVLDVVGAFDGGRLGLLHSPPAGVRVAARIGSLVATGATGTLTVPGVEPLRLTAEVRSAMARPPVGSAGPWSSSASSRR